jgi:arabinofuranosyltransferase
MGRMRRKVWLGVWAALCALAFASLAYGQRWIHDDGFINLRIVRNVVLGHGPVFNPGERIEVGTSPLWIALLSILHRLGARPEYAAIALGLILSVGAVALLPFASARPAEAGRGVWVPVGLLVFASVPTAWQYATSGLETSLACAWLVASSMGLVRAMRTRSGAWLKFGVAICVGLGPLVRPDYFIYTALFLGVLVGRSRRRRDRVLLLGAAFAAPMVVEGLRMGYFSTLGPNTALAKEAFRTNVPQGMCYLKTFLGSFWLAWPLLPVLFLTVCRIEALRRHDKYAAAATAAPVLGAILHTGYLVAIGGDYMHSRLLLPNLLAFVVPTAVVLLPTHAKRAKAIHAFAGALVVLWAPGCALFLRPPKENVCGIGDEHGWYLREAHKRHPVLIEHYGTHPFYTEREPVASSEESRTLFTGRDASPLARGVDAHIERAVVGGAIGILGYSLPSSVHVIDKHGLSDPVAARFELGARGRPGHEKELTRTWAVARFAAPAPDDEADVRAARSALGCGGARDLLESIRGPVDVGRFFDNASKAFAHQRLRISPDPFVALARLCRNEELRRDVRGGRGGAPFTWMCAPESHAVGVRLYEHPDNRSIAAVALVCSEEAKPGKPFGERAGQGIAQNCPAGARLSGLHGTFEGVVQSVGLVCTREGQTIRTSPSGAARGQPFDVACKEGARAGLAGRAGAAIDAIGVVCTP